MSDTSTKIGAVLDPASTVLTHMARGSAQDLGIYETTGDLKTQANEQASEEESKLSAENAALEAADLERRQRNSMFQASDEGTLNVGSRDTYYGN